MSDRGLFLALHPPGVGRGARLFAPIPQPVAGAEWEWVVPSGYYWRPVSIFQTLITSAQVAARFPGFAVRDQDGGMFMVGDAGGSVAASKTNLVCFAQDIALNVNTESGIVTSPFADMLLPAGYRVTSRTPNIQTEDKYAEGRVWVEQYEDRGDLNRHDAEHIALDIHLQP